jgi:hypothetical protein
MVQTTTQAIKMLPVLSAIQAAPPLPALAPPPLAQAQPLIQASIARDAPYGRMTTATNRQLTTELGEIATEYFKRFTTKTKDADTTYGIYNKGSKFYVGDTKIRIQGDDRIVGDRVYEGTPG